jgi:hypothetical protein
MAWAKSDKMKLLLDDLLLTVSYTAMRRPLSCGCENAAALY